MKKIFITFLALLITIISVHADDKSSALKEYQEKMEYWVKRSNSAFECKNRFELGMFLYDSTFEEGIGPIEELKYIVEFKTIEKMDCVINSLRIIPPEKRLKVIKHYYLEPLYNKTNDYKKLIER